MDRSNIDLISPTPLGKKTKNNQPTSPNFESHDSDNYPQDQGEIRNQGPSAHQPSKADTKITSLDLSARGKQKIILLTPTAQDQDQHERILDESQIGELAQRFVEGLSKQRPFIEARAKQQQKCGLVGLEDKSSEEGTEMEIEEEKEEEEEEEEKVDPEDYEDDSDDADSYLDLIENLGEVNEDSLVQDAQPNEEEELDLEESQVFKGSNGSTGEPPFEAIEEIHQERSEFNGNESWSENNEDQNFQCMEERNERNPSFCEDRSFQNSKGNNENSMIQNMENFMNDKFSLNAKEPFLRSGIPCKVNFANQATSRKYNESSCVCGLLTCLPERFLDKGQTKS